jgi:hypothetical protein
MVYKLVFRNARTDNRNFWASTGNFSPDEMQAREEYVRLLENLAVEFNTKRVSYTANNISILAYDFDTESAARDFRLRMNEIREATGMARIMFIRNKSESANTGTYKSSILLYKDNELIDTILHTSYDKS